VRPLDHGLGGRHLGLAHRGRGLHVYDDGVLHVDQIIRAIGIDGWATPSGSPARGGINRGDELGFHRRGGPEGGIIQGGEVFGHGPLGLRLELLSCFNPALTLRVGDDHAGIDRKAFAANEPFCHAASDDGLEQFAQQIGIAEASVAGLGEG
jgi:hypothetical protein